jgi:hypothetical protein
VNSWALAAEADRMAAMIAMADVLMMAPMLRDKDHHRR